MLATSDPTSQQGARSEAADDDDDDVLASQGLPQHVCNEKLTLCTPVRRPRNVVAAGSLGDAFPARAAPAPQPRYPPPPRPSERAVAQTARPRPEPRSIARISARSTSAVRGSTAPS